MSHDISKSKVLRCLHTHCSCSRPNDRCSQSLRRTSSSRERTRRCRTETRESCRRRASAAPSRMRSSAATRLSRPRSRAPHRRPIAVARTPSYCTERSRGYRWGRGSELRRCRRHSRNPRRTRTTATHTDRSYSETLHPCSFSALKRHADKASSHKADSYEILHFTFVLW